MMIKKWVNPNTDDKIRDEEDYETDDKFDIFVRCPT